MNENVLIDLGDKWGHSVPINHLENIIHIEVLSEEVEENTDGLILFSQKKTKIEKRLKITVAYREGQSNEVYKEFSYVSDGYFTDKEIKKERNRFLGFSHGVISEKELISILDKVSSYLGKNYTLDDFDESSLNFGYLKKKIADIQGKPYFKIQIMLDPNSKNMISEEYYNDEFFKQAFTENMRKNTEIFDDHEKAILYASEVLQELMINMNLSLPVGSEEEDSENVPSLMKTGFATQKINDATKGKSLASSEFTVIRGN